MSPEAAHSLDLPGRREAVPRARRFVADLLSSWDLAELAPDAATVVSELVTNAVLHAGTEVTVRVSRDGPAVRLEVADGNPAGDVRVLQVPNPRRSLLSDEDESMALRAMLEEEATTGRGLMLVAAFASHWGVTTGSDGKSVWAVIGAGSPPRPADDGRVPVVEQPVLRGLRPVRLVALPVRLALESEVQLDAFVREVQVAGTTTLPAGLAALATELLASRRPLLDSMHVAARDAAGRGDRLLDLNLVLAEGSDDGVRRLLALLDQLDDHCRTGALLAFAASPELRDFRGWYADELGRQLAGLPPRPCPYVATQLPVATAATRLADARAAELDRVADELALASSPEEVFRLLVSESVSALGASRASVCLVDLASHLVNIVESIGYPDEVRGHWGAFPLAADLPASESIRSGRTVVLRTPAERDERYPAFLGTPVLDEAAFVCVPVPPDAPPARGALIVNFTAARDFSSDDLAVLSRIAGETGKALDRLTAAAEVADREALLALAADVARRFAAGDQAPAAFQELAQLLVTWVVEWCSVHVADEHGQLRLAAVAHVDPGRVDLARQLHLRYPPQPGAASIGRTFVTGRTDVFQVVPAELLPTLAKDADHLALLQELGLGSGATVAIRRDDEIFGVVAVANGAGRYLTDRDLAAVEGAVAELAQVLPGS